LESPERFCLRRRADWPGASTASRWSSRAHCSRSTTSARGHDLVAAGFLVFAAGQGLILSGAAMDPADTVSPFAAGAGLWAAGLTLISVPRVLPLLVRILGLIAAVLFAIFALQVFSGNPLTSLSTPLPLFAYPFLVVTLLCWAWVYFRAGPR
jgi:hypothetical protein